MSRLQSYLILCVLVLTIAPVAQAAPNEEKIKARDEALKQASEAAWQDNLKQYEQHILPLLKQKCVGCHNEKKQEGELSFVSLDPNMEKSTSGARWATVRERLELKEMPPEDSPQLSEKESAIVLEWIKAEMKRSRRNFTRREQAIQANKVPHDLLFDPGQKFPLDNPPRVRRNSSFIYEAFRYEQAKGFENLISNPFTPDGRYPFKDMGTPQIDLPTTSQLLRNALTIVQRQTGHTVEKNGTLKPAIGTKKEFLKFFDPKTTLDQATLETVINMQFQRVLGRNPSEEELTKFVSLTEKNIQDAGQVAGLRFSLAAIYMLPEAVFRFELGREIEQQGKVRLTPREIAFALAYTLTDKRPPSWLLAAADSGKLDTKEGVAAAIDQIYADPKMSKPRILRFFHEFFEYPKALDVFKNPSDFKPHNPRVLVNDTDLLVQWILDKDENVLQELLTTNRAFVNMKYDSNKKKYIIAEAKSMAHLSYSLPTDWKWTDKQPIELPNNIRAGILTQPSWLVAWSLNEENHAILRGKWVREKLLGNVVPDIPITVDAQLPEAPNKTLRERMAVTRENYCWQCHKLMNPVGLPFELYDHFGRWRAIEKDKPVDATGRIDLTGDDRLNVETKDAIEFVHELAKSERVEQVFIRHVFRYFAGRNENLGDGPSLQAAQQAYRDSGGSFKALVQEILTSESFLYRTPDFSVTSDSESP